MTGADWRMLYDLQRLSEQVVLYGAPYVQGKLHEARLAPCPQSGLPAAVMEPARKVNGSATETVDGGVTPLYGEPLVGLEPTTAPVSDPGPSRTTTQVAPPANPDCPAHHGAGAPKNHPETSTQAQPDGPA